MDILENVTVIIPAHNRPERLQRLLDYYRGTGLRVIVPDSSDALFTGRMDPEQVVYLHRPGLHFLLKIREILPMISTRYVFYCADDDFIVPEAVCEIAEFLDRNPSYSCAQGHYLTFTPRGDGVRFTPRYIRSFDSYVDGDSAVERLTGQFGMYASVLYGVVRTDAFIRTYQYCFDSKGEPRFRNLYLAEEFFHNSMLIHGCYATLPCFYSAREQIRNSAAQITVPSSVIKNSPEYRPEFDGFVRGLTLLLSECAGMPESESEALIRRVVSAPADKPSVLFKRRVNAFLDRHPLLGWASRLSVWRYHQKGLKAVRGLQSYPCTFSTPATEAIVRAVRSGGNGKNGC